MTWFQKWPAQDIGNEFRSGQPTRPRSAGFFGHPRQSRIGPLVFQTHYIKQLAELLPRGDVAEPAKECQIEVKFKLKDSSALMTGPRDFRFDIEELFWSKDCGRHAM